MTWWRWGGRGAALGLLAAAGMSACREGGARSPEDGAPGVAASPTGTPDAASPVVAVPERWTSARDTAWNLDTPATWVGPGGEARVLVTAKGTHDLKVFDARSGAVLQPIGGPGDGPGRFRRPNAVVVAGDLAFVVERDNHRIQVLHLPDGGSTGFVGVDVLERPYGIVLSGSLPELTLWVTDDYETPVDGTGDLTRRVHRFRVHLDAEGRPTVREHVAFGDPGGPGALAVVETIGIDPARDRLFVADEARKAYLAYDTAGVFTGAMLADGRIQGDPEGMALVACADGSGYWVTTDQQPEVSWFRVFRRGDLTYLGSFRGDVTANTDGVSYAPGPVPGFTGGVFLAVHDDEAVSAFGWEDVAAALGLRPACG